MIDFKSEILAKIQKEDKKVDLYNSVIKEYIPQIKDIFEYSNLKVDCHEIKDGLIKITIISEDNRTKYHFSYNDIKRYLYLNPSDDIADKDMIENKLKDFVLEVAEKEDIRIKETSENDSIHDCGSIKISIYDNFSNQIKDLSNVNNLKQISKIEIYQKRIKSIWEII